MQKNVIAVERRLGHIKKVKSTEGRIVTLVITTRGIGMGDSQHREKAEGAT